MGLGPRLDLRQTQSLVMTPQLQQAIKLLALSNLEIEAFVAEELEKNPLIEAGGEDGAAEIAETIEPVADPLPDSLAGGGEQALDIDPGEERFQDSAADAMAGMAATAGGSGEDAPDLDQFAAALPTLAEHLDQQIGTLCSGEDLAIARHLIACLDEAGYVAVPLDEVAARLGQPLARVERALAAVQSLDPTGVGARDLAECLALQAREADRYDPAMATLIGHLDLLARGQIAALRRLCGVDEEDFADMVRELRAYDPKPGARFAAAEASPVVPDIFVTATTAGGWSVELNAATLPRLIVNRRYQAELGHAARDPASKAWLAECATSANWLIKALDQRARTIVRVATEIVRLQDGFFRHGVEQLRPLTLRTVAEAIGMHESTVSRVTSNKYLACGRGLFELKYFFTSAIQAADGGQAASAAAVKNHIARLIAEEPADAVLSDDALVDLLRARGFDIARRTVAKYREALGLGSSVQRRRQRRIAG
ncbi:RNA polymerase factor sigma-54 [Sphingomonas morindae]|uniref:RNA polymerase sigma-54 factor n=1 Tax=Sphingomonas morindae TaxID=1541170 RepID=A0ABY4XB42_9SPHN|nr:RNA polymerase factor sigma-54 [Sphingomonas morindae]USI74169.1 RNA polymerase factor sigma-54 [Sphingomonas morindae]